MDVVLVALAPARLRVPAGLRRRRRRRRLGRRRWRWRCRRRVRMGRRGWWRRVGMGSRPWPHPRASMPPGRRFDHSRARGRRYAPDEGDRHGLARAHAHAYVNAKVPLRRPRMRSASAMADNLDLAPTGGRAEPGERAERSLVERILDRRRRRGEHLLRHVRVERGPPQVPGGHRRSNESRQPQCLRGQHDDKCAAGVRRRD